jgi:hypothetical protein
MQRQLERLFRPGRAQGSESMPIVTQGVALGFHVVPLRGDHVER